MFLILESECTTAIPKALIVVAETAPAGFTVDRKLELRASVENKATVRYANHVLEGKEILAHISSGKRVTRLAMTWNDRMSFVMNEHLQIKRIDFLDIIKEESSEVAENEDERFELDFVLMTSELTKLLTALSEALGGEDIAV